MAKNKKVLIFGASEGLGFEIAKNLIQNGHLVFISSSNPLKIKNSYKILKTFDSKHNLFGYKKCDVSQENDVKKIFSLIRNKDIKLDSVINCAGVYGPKGTFYENSYKDWETAIKINLLGTFLVNKYAIKNMTKIGSIINLSGGGATKAIPFVSSYCASKSAVVRMSETFAKEMILLKKKIYINALAPGALNTKMLSELINAGKNIIGKENFIKAKIQLKEGGDPLSNPINFCRIFIENNSFGITGKLISAKWDNWEKFNQKNAIELNNSEKYTLVRKI
jgi:NAD(P)-dependent dehydrogenase (short-subunit alcohol dehydrogenase family)